MGRHKNPYIGDARTRQARAEGFPARSVFKLQEIDERCALLRRGARVLDLGAAPGSWTSYAAKRVGSEGLVVAVDLQELRLPPLPNAVIYLGDAFELAGELSTHGPYDIVMSDMAPSTSGSKLRDQVRSFELFEMALGLAEQLGRASTVFVGKLFMGPDFERARSETRRIFGGCRVIKPRGTRQNSSEVFLVGRPD